MQCCKRERDQTDQTAKLQDGHEVNITALFGFSIHVYVNFFLCSIPFVKIAVKTVISITFPVISGTGTSRNLILVATMQGRSLLV